MDFDALALILGNNRHVRKVYILALSLILTFNALPVNAAAKAGTTCKTLGQTSVVGSKTFTCIKSGKKLVWNKGEISANPNNAPTQPTGQAYSTAKDFAIKLSNVNLIKSDNKYLWSENLSASQVQFMIDIQEKFFSFWKNQGILFTKPITTYYFTEKDRGWISKYSISNECLIDNWFSEPFKNNADGKTCQTNDKSSLILIPLGSEYVKQTTNFKDWASGTAAHEIEHVVQNEVFNYQMPDPCWFREGITTYSVWIQTSYDDSFNSMKALKKSTYDFLLSSLKKSNVTVNGKSYENWTKQEWLEVLNYVPSNPVCWGRNMDGTVTSNPVFFGYSAGPFIVEKMYIDFGLTQSVRFMYAVGANNNWSTAFFQTFGISYSDWMLNSAIPWLLGGG